jgi:hypothetical protein
MQKCGCEHDLALPGVRAARQEAQWCVRACWPGAGHVLTIAIRKLSGCVCAEVQMQWHTWSETQAMYALAWHSADMHPKSLTIARCRALLWPAAQVVAAVTQQDLASGFVVPPLLRFVSAEGAYLSNANGGPRMFLNIEDHLTDSTGRVNARFQARPRRCTRILQADSPGDAWRIALICVL